MKKERMNKNNPLFTASLIPHGNGKLLDFDSLETGEQFRYAQFNTRALLDCPFRSAGCTAVCYATKGNHQFPSVKASRSRSYEVSREEDFAERMIYTINYHAQTKRYDKKIMIIRIHESGDFYSVQYLKKWVKVWERFFGKNNVHFVFYTKSFSFFLMLTEEEKNVIRSMMKNGQVAMNLSIDDTTTKEQLASYLQMIAAYPLANTYRVTEKISATDDKCDCSDCARCGSCNKAQGKEKVVQIHSASNADIEVYNENKRERK